MAGATRVAVRKGATLSYLLADHLGSSSLSTDSAGNRTSELRYKPWGETRFSFGTMPTKYTFTGQFSYTDDPSTPGSEGFGLMYYGARWYDNNLGRFAQADTVVPSGVQGQDRYAYANNNPLRYKDPSGHTACEEYDENGNCIDDTPKTPSEKILEELEGTFGWHTDGKFSLSELKMLLEAGYKILSYVDGITSGKGSAWMAKFMSGTTFVHGNLFGNNYTTGNTIHLIAGGFSARTVVHELGHIYDNNSKSAGFGDAAILGGGNADAMFTSITGRQPMGLRFTNCLDDRCLLSGVFNSIPAVYRWPGTDDYGHNSTADYFAEVFEHAVYAESSPADSQAILEGFITYEASTLPK